MKKQISVTKFLDQCSNPFDTEAHASKTAEKLSLTTDEVKEMWDGKGDNSKELGKYLHKMPENYMLGLPYLPSKKHPRSYIMLSWIRQYFESLEFTPIESELLIETEQFKGQIDNVSLNYDNGFILIDFKSDEYLDTNNYGKFMISVLRPLRIPDSNFNRHCLQLSIYKIMYEQVTGNKVGKMYIVLIGNKDHETIEAIDYSEQLKLLPMFA